MLVVLDKEEEEYSAACCLESAIILTDLGVSTATANLLEVEEDEVLLPPGEMLIFGRRLVNCGCCGVVCLDGCSSMTINFFTLRSTATTEDDDAFEMVEESVVLCCNNNDNNAFSYHIFLKSC